VAAFERLLGPDRASWKLDLSRIQTLVAALDHPERAYPTVLIAGTNGKGSVAAMVERALRAAGLRTGRYTSPHLVRPEERIAIDGVPVDAGLFDRAIEDVLAVEATCLADARLTERASFFEAMTAIAFELLRRARVDVGIIEVGLGGRLDATNVCDPVATAVVSIDLDHQAWLGSTHAAIAAEKGAIARPGVPLVVGDLTDAALDAVVAAADAAGAPLVYAAEGVECVIVDRGTGSGPGSDRGAGPKTGDGHLTITLSTATRTYGPVRLALAGEHQAANAFVAVALLEALDDAGLHVDRRAVETGLGEARWPGRLDRVTLPDGRRALLDAAHNAAGARALAAWLARRAPGARPPLVFAAARDKDVRGMIRALAPVVGDIVVTAFADPRALDPDALAAEVRAALDEIGEPAEAAAARVHAAASPAAALETAWQRSRDIVVAGSIFLLGEVYPRLGRSDPFQPDRSGPDRFEPGN
jgi:dihydrofolate synthase/folylpolyglutamate synthase